MSFQSVRFDAGTNDKVENMPADGYYLVNDHITLSAPTREGYTFLGWSAAQDTPVITANPRPTARRCIRQTMSGLSSATYLHRRAGSSTCRPSTL